MVLYQNDRLTCLLYPKLNPAVGLINIPALWGRFTIIAIGGQRFDQYIDLDGFPRSLSSLGEPTTNSISVPCLELFCSL